MAKRKNCVNCVHLRVTVKVKNGEILWNQCSSATCSLGHWQRENGIKVVERGGKVRPLEYLAQRLICYTAATCPDFEYDESFDGLVSPKKQPKSIGVEKVQLTA